MSHRRRSTGKPLGGDVAWAAFAVCLGFPKIISPADAVILDVRGYAQEAEQWCWAASGQAVIEFLAPELKSQACQCRQAEIRLTGLKCCAAANSCTPRYPLDPLCAEPGWPEFGSYNLDFQTTCDPLPESDWHRCVGEPLTWPKLTNEIRSGRPVLFAQRPRDQSSEAAIGHSMIAFGYTTTMAQGQQNRWVLVFDPKRVCRSSCVRPGPPCCHGDSWWLSYEEYRTPGAYSHWIDFYGIRKKRAKDSADRSSGPSPR
jgi:hypothetical protein